MVRLRVVGTDLAGRSTRRGAPPVRLARGAGIRAAAAIARHPEPNDVDGDEVRNEVDNCPDAPQRQPGGHDRDEPSPARSADVPETRATTTTTTTACPTPRPTTAAS